MVLTPHRDHAVVLHTGLARVISIGLCEALEISACDILGPPYGHSGSRTEAETVTENSNLSRRKSASCGDLMEYFRGVKMPYHVGGSDDTFSVGLSNL